MASLAFLFASAFFCLLTRVSSGDKLALDRFLDSASSFRLFSLDGELCRLRTVLAERRDAVARLLADIRKLPNVRQGYLGPRNNVCAATKVNKRHALQPGPSQHARLTLRLLIVACYNA